jgi:hypothetical protein
MAEHRWVWGCLVMCMACGPSTPPAEEPAPVEEAPPIEEEAPPIEEEAPPIEEPAPVEEETAEPPPPAEPKVTCTELDKKKCQITKGCAWNDIKKCIDEEGGP